MHRVQVLPPLLGILEHFPSLSERKLSILALASVSHTSSVSIVHRPAKVCDDRKGLLLIWVESSCVAVALVAKRTNAVLVPDTASIREVRARHGITHT
eukprot:2861496-Rhodomonas_salina.1